MDREINDEKPPNYRKQANLFTALFILWTHNIFKVGRKRDLYEEDMPEPLLEHKSSYLGEKISRLWSKEYKRAISRKELPSLSKVLLQCFAKEYFLCGTALAVIELLVKPCQPIFIGLLVRYFSHSNAINDNVDTEITYLYRVFYFFEENQSKIQTSEAIVYASLIVLCSAISICVQHPYMLSVMHLGMKVRVACMSLMYRKTLRMSMLALSPTTVGNIVNLMSNDATRFDIVTMFLHYLWISPLQMILFIFMMYNHVGPAAFVGATVLFIFIPIQIILAHFNKILRYKTALKTDERVRLMNEIISGIQIIKMYAWEVAFCKLIHKSRRQEMQLLVKTSYIRGLIMSMIMFTARIALFCTLASFVVLFKEEINSETVFIVSGYYIIMRSSMTVFFPQGVTQFAETLITIKRTRDYLLNEDAIIGNTEILHPDQESSDPYPIFFNNEISRFSSSSTPMVVDQFVPSIRIVEAYARWSKHYVLRNIELIIKNEELHVIIGQVGSGKTSLLHVILKELPVCEGYVSVKGQVSFASCEPWLFAGSVRQNIIFGHAFDRDRYRMVCRACALLKDFELLPYGDQTVVGERGISLSGGQRARVNLARCIYKEADIYILDDPLSAVDTHVGTQIFEECIKRFLKNKIRILCTHQLQYLHGINHIIIMEKGRILAKGTFSELQNSGLDFAQYLEKETTKGSNPQPPPPPPPLPPLTEKDLRVDIFKQVSYAETSAENLQDDIHSRQSLLETRSTGVVDCKLYGQYLRAGGNWCYILSVILLFLGSQTAASTSDFFIGLWTKIEEMKHEAEHTGLDIKSTLNSKQCILGYTIVTELLLMLSIVRSFAFFYVCLRASIKLHDEMFESIIFAHMRFYNNNPSGRILNRFSKDMGAVDEDLPYAMIDFFQMMLNLVGVFVVLSVTNFYLIIPIFTIIIAIYFLRSYYLKTSRSLKRVEGVARSYVYAHLNASIQGLSTIRSHDAESILTYEFDKHMDLHSSAWYLFIATARAFSLWTDIMCVSLISISSFGYLILQQVTSLKIMAGDVGLSITQCLQLTGTIPWGMRQSAEMENHMTSVERINDFINIEHEPELRATSEFRPPKQWPEAGEIIFHDTVLRYSPHENPVLKNLNIIISPEEKVGIVGRTGAGKSSLISALFRLAYQSGAIYIDGVDIFKIGIHDLREKIAIIPQEPIIFTGTLRFNLDPYHNYSDQTLLAALSVVELELTSKNVLMKPLVEGGSNFSAGEKQLLCLARAIVRNNKILILDEATANMDPRTDRLIQTTIRSKFAKCTVLTIAHRLHTIMDSDRVLVMHAGDVVEFDHPHLLLERKTGYFVDLVNQTGPATADFLRKIAENNYFEKNYSNSGLRDSNLEEEII